jgi:hypothetical protein
LTTKIKYNEVEHDLLYSVEYPDSSYPIIERYNPIDGSRDWVNVKYYETFAIKEHLFKYGSGATDHCKILDGFQGLKVQFKPHYDSDYVKDDLGNYVDYWFYDFKITLLEANSDKYLLTMRLISDNYKNKNADNLYLSEDGDVLYEDIPGFIIE